MTDPTTERNRRILLVDDNRAIHADFRKILAPDTAADAALAASEAALFGGTPARARSVVFETESAYQGLEGVALAQRALRAGRPFAMAFVDVRMPPGIDGVETTRRLWAVDPSLEIVICTAYSDYAWEEIFDATGRPDQIVILKKPFDAIEALQLAWALTEKWNLGQAASADRARLEAQLQAEVAKGQGLVRAAQNMMEDAVAAAARSERSNRELRAEIERRKVAEAALARRGEELERSYADLERLSQISAHDLQEPLRAILGCAQLMERRYGGQEGAGEMLGFVRTAVHRMRDTIEELSDYLSIGDGDEAPQVTDLDRLLREALDRLAARIRGAGATVTHGPLPSVPARPRQMARLLEALVENALERGGQPPQVQVRAEQASGAWTFSVCDNGPPVEPATAEKMFELLQRAGGSATRLPICRRIVELHGGRIWVEPAAHGAACKFTLPGAGPRAEAAAGRVPP